MNEERRAAWMVNHHTAMSLIAGGAFGACFAGAVVLNAAVQGHAWKSAGLLGAAVVIGVVTGAPFGFLFMREMRPLFEQLQSRTLDRRAIIGAQWRRDHERSHRHPWFWFWLPFAAVTTGFVQSVYRLASAETAESICLSSLFAVVALALALYLTALWRSPSPPWRRP